METVILSPAHNHAKKWRVTFENGSHVEFGASGYEDYTIHHDPERQRRYIARHQSRENWTESGIKTAGFWSRWLLWNLPSLDESLNDIEQRWNIIVEEEQ